MQSRPSEQPHGRTTPLHVRVLRTLEDDHVRRPMRWAMRVLLALALAVAVFWQGGASIWALKLEGALVGLALVVAVATRARTTLRVRAALPWLGLGVITAAEIIPFPHSVVAFLSPRAVQIADASRAALGLAPSSLLPLALTPGDAALQAALYLIAGTWAVLATIALAGSTGTQATRLLRSGFIILALVDAWIWLGAYSPMAGEFLPDGIPPLLQYLCLVNGNHQSALTNLAFALALGEVARAPNIRKQTVQGLFATFLAIAVMLITSRGGVLIMCMTLALKIATLPAPPKYLRVDKSKREDHSRLRMAAIIAALILAAAVLALPALEREFLVADLSHDAKLSSFERLPHLLAGSWLTGTGPGGLAVVAGMHSAGGFYRVEFAENIVLERLFGGGILVTLAWFAGLFWVARDLWRRRTGVEGATALHIGLGLVLVANLVDFSLEVSGVLLSFLAMAACLERISAEHGRSTAAADHRRSHATWVAVAAVALLLAGGLLVRADRGATRQSVAALQGKTAAQMRQRILQDFAYDHHSFYLLGRRLLEDGDRKGAVKAFDRAVQLRPDSKFARLFRLTARLGENDPKGAADDLRWLLRNGDNETVALVLQTCITLPGGDNVLVAVVPGLLDKSYDIAVILKDRRPDVVERIALAIRALHPGKHFAIDGIVGLLYLRMGKLEPAGRLASVLLADPTTRAAGYVLEASILVEQKHYYEAYHLLSDVCDKDPNNFDACGGAMYTILQSGRPLDAYQYVRSRMPYLRNTPSQAATYNYWLAQTQIQLERYDEAVESLRLAAGLNGETAGIAGLLARCLIKVGQYREARELVDKYMKLLPSDQGFQALSADIDRETRPATMQNVH